MVQELSIKVNHEIKDVVVDIPTDIKETLPLLLTLTETIAEYYDMSKEEILGVMAEYLLEEEE